MNNFLGEIRLVGFYFAPLGWHDCDGSLLPISENDALFALIGTTYGGDGFETFGLPDLRGRVPRGVSFDAPNGTTQGLEQVALGTTQIPSHSHGFALASGGTSNNPSGRTFAPLPAAAQMYSPSSSGVAGSLMIGNAGGSQPHENMQPYLAVRFIIALQGIFPSRS
jgi:microcystin-dependent protein